MQQELSIYCVLFKMGCKALFIFTGHIYLQYLFEMAIIYYQHYSHI